MYIEHPNFIIEKTIDIPLWRYMDLWKFLNLLSTSKLYFPSVEVLREQHEGRIPQEMIEYFRSDFASRGSHGFREDYQKFLEKLRPKTLISSWTFGHHESFALWKMYAREKLGIAIKSNIERLKRAFKQTDKDVYIGGVSYYDLNKPRYKVGNTFGSFLVKRNFYSFESEVR